MKPRISGQNSRLYRRGQVGLYILYKLPSRAFSTLWAIILKPRDYKNTTRDEALRPVLNFECYTGLRVSSLVAFMRVCPYACVFGSYQSQFLRETWNLVHIETLRGRPVLFYRPVAFTNQYKSK